MGTSSPKIAILDAQGGHCLDMGRYFCFSTHHCFVTSVSVSPEQNEWRTWARGLDFLIAADWWVASERVNSSYTGNKPVLEPVQIRTKMNPNMKLNCTVCCSCCCCCCLLLLLLLLLLLSVDFVTKIYVLQIRGTFLPGCVYHGVMAGERSIQTWRTH